MAPVNADAPACSVVIPVRDRRLEIQAAIASVLAQTLQDFELIVVDDGSSDGSGEAALACSGGRARVVRQERGGVSAARNRGVAEAKAPWIAFLDSDDAWTPRFLERMLPFAQAHPELAIAFSNCRNVRDGGPWLELPFRQPTVVEDYVSLLIAGRGRGLQTSTTLVNRAAFVAAGGFAPGVARSEDVDLWLRLALTAPIGCVPEVLVDFHNEAIAVTRAIPTPVFPQPVRTLRALRAAKALDERRAAQSLRLEALYLLIYAEDLVDHGDLAEARALLLRECRWRDCPARMLAKALARSFLGVRPGRRGPSPETKA